MSKRDFDSMAGSTSSPYMPMFEHFRQELDEHHDRRERIIKASRDITAASKKVIFTLQRVRELQKPLPQHVAKGNKQYYETIAAQAASIGSELQLLNAHRYARQISGGCQEFIEAVSFEHYLVNARLLSYEESVDLVQKLNPDGLSIGLSSEDYLLGIYDMTGELMKFAITAMATAGALPSLVSSDIDHTVGDVASAHPQRTLLTDMRGLRAALESIDAGSGPFARDVEKKREVMQASVEKVEKALYGLIVRGAERPKGWMPDTSDASRAIEVES